MEQEYKQIRKGSGFVYACANMMYRRVKILTATDNFSVQVYVYQ